MVASVADDSQSVFLEAPDFLHSNVEPPNSLFTEFCGIRHPLVASRLNLGGNWFETKEIMKM
jgi:hypothetical protein